MDTCQLDMLHHSRHKGMLTIGDSIGLTLHGMYQKAVDKDRTVRSHTNCCLHIICHVFIIVDHLHAAAAQYIRRTHHHGVTDLCSDIYGLLYGSCHAAFRHGDGKLIHHRPKLIPVLCQIDDLGRCTQDLYTVFLQIRRQI